MCTHLYVCVSETKLNTLRPNIRRLHFLYGIKSNALLTEQYAFFLQFFQTAESQKLPRSPHQRTQNSAGTQCETQHTYSANTYVLHFKIQVSNSPQA